MTSTAPQRSNTDRMRNASIDALRLLAMFLIVACHSILHVTWMLHVDQGLTPAPSWKQAAMYVVVQYGQVGVSIFFIITGWFMVKKPFTFARPISAWAQMWLYSSVTYILMLCLFLAGVLPSAITPLFTGTPRYEAVVWSFAPFLWGSYWFMTAYLVLLLLAPYINRIFLEMSAHASAALFVLVTLFSVWLLLGNRVGNWNNVTYAALGYMVGAWLRLHVEKLPVVLTSRRCLITAITGSTVTMLVFNRISLGSSRLAHFLGWTAQTKPGIQALPVLIATAIFLFTMLYTKPLDSTGRRGRVVVSLSGAMFTVYLIHENTFIYRILWPTLETPFSPDTGAVPRIISWAVLTLVAFLALTSAAWICDHFFGMQHLSRLVAAKVTQTARRIHERVRGK